MIRYPIILDELWSRIEAEAPGWMADAAGRTERFRRAGRYDEESSSWGRIKRVYMRIQHEKCAYCERQLTVLQSEKPLLLYPLGDLDEDPEDVLTFLGINPVPREAIGPRGRRARVTVDLFELDRREELWRERAEKIVALFLALEHRVSTDPAVRALAREAIDSLVSPSHPHTSCARAFRELYEKDRERASEIARAAQTYLSSQS